MLIERKCVECGEVAIGHHGVASIMEACLASGASCVARHDHVFAGVAPSSAPVNLEAIAERLNYVRYGLLGRRSVSSREEAVIRESFWADIDVLIAEVKQLRGALNGEKD